MKEKLSLMLVAVALVSEIAGSSFTYYFYPRIVTTPVTGPREPYTLRWSFAGGLVLNAYKEYIVPSFEKKYPWIHIELIPFGTGSEHVAALKAAKNAGTTPPLAGLNVPWGAIDQYYDEGLLAPLNYRNIPNAVQQFFPPPMPGYGPPNFISAPTMLVYRADKLKELNFKPTNSLADLTNPIFRGKVGFPTIRNNMGAAMVLVERMVGGNPSTDPSLSKAFTWVKDYLMPNKPVFWESSSDSQTLFETGEVWITPIWDGQAYDLKKKDVPITIVVPKEGAFVFYSSLQMTQGSEKNAYEIELWINHLISQEMQADYLERTGYWGCNKNVKLPKSREGLALPRETLDSFELYDRLFAYAHLEEWLTTWEKVMAGK